MYCPKIGCLVVVAAFYILMWHYFVLLSCIPYLHRKDFGWMETYEYTSKIILNANWSPTFYWWILQESLSLFGHFVTTESLEVLISHCQVWPDSGKVIGRQTEVQLRAKVLACQLSNPVKRFPVNISTYRAAHVVNSLWHLKVGGSESGILETNNLWQVQVWDEQGKCLMEISWNREVHLGGEYQRWSGVPVWQGAVIIDFELASLMMINPPGTFSPCSS